MVKNVSEMERCVQKHIFLSKKQPETQKTRIDRKNELQNILPYAFITSSLNKKTQKSVSIICHLGKRKSQYKKNYYTTRTFVVTNGFLLATFNSHLFFFISFYYSVWAPIYALLLLLRLHSTFQTHSYIQQQQQKIMT